MGAFNIVKRKNEITVDYLKDKFPRKKNTITEGLANNVDTIVNSDEFDSTNFMKHLVDYQSVMMDCSASIMEYINAVRFVGYLESEKTLIDAYKKARAGDDFVRARMNVKTGTTAYGELSNAASRYRRSPLVKQLLVQSDMPLYLMFQAQRYKAVTVLANEMETAPLSRDRIAAAEKLLTHVKAPEDQTIELKMGLTNEAQSMQQQLFAQLAETSKLQHRRLVNGEAIDDVQKLNLTTEFVEAEVDKDA